MENIKEFIAKAKKEIKEAIKNKHFIRTGEAMDIVERVTGQCFADDEVYDDLMDILNGATENLNSLTLQNGEGYYVGTYKKDIAEFLERVDIDVCDSVWSDFIQIGYGSIRLRNFIS